MSNIAKEIIDKQSSLESKRATYDSHCREVAELILPRQDQFFREQRTPGDKRSQKIIDTVAQLALTKFAAAMESILTPRSSIWHKLSTSNEQINEIQEVKEYLDYVNNILFKKRYASNANFSSQQHETYMSLGAFGTGVLQTSDDIENKGIRYKSTHISEHFFIENAVGSIDTNYRLYELTALQAAQKFGEENLPKGIKKAVEKEPLERFKFIHCVIPNEDINRNALDYRGFKYKSFHVSIDENKLLGEGGFRTFPYHISRYVTAPNEIYGRSPAMMALGEIKMLNAIRKSDLRARHMAIDPPVLTSSERAISRLLLQPSAINYGTLDENGNPMVKPYQSGANINVSNDALNKSHEIINDAFLVTLFQILVETPQMTATEVLQRAQEKGALLSPTAGRQQSEALGPMIEREIDILAHSGQIPPMPQVLQEAAGEFEIEYTAPLNVMQKASEAAAATAIINDAVPLAEFYPAILNNFDFDAYLQIMREARGAPAKMFRTPEEIESINQQQAQERQLQQALEAAPSVAGSIKDIAQAEAFSSGS